ncbi:unnamed protein product [Aspergillus oryzae RIB40]|uniref:RNA polymerase II subunit B1 CTD phosphatase RPAP2 homolog n=2 Tax=Aspergillus oryzae TaxID=5062 RepID=Q2U033_ASPOR|nr:unnamed protein product [Aspergillus oryzae RIB40]EIT78192.1 hypothetical protein Ao3042_05538 [Aspergillus oryzae 3.042]KDE77762.1 hypothetical protein AO1008_03841 [Aspergillus oryzae 100-8]BAE65082.1 unnamed protein product [Aspergillus oryzae RIB40]|eukprot:EIT78192.1 hypothetical protein Ao3042_05538 [Aspergillus oryzae 3.042]
MSTSRSHLKTSLPSAHAASTQAPSSMRRAPPKSTVSLQQKGQPANKPDADPRHLAIALHHAHRIQAQKDTESLILDRILELVTFPSSPSADPASPSPEDAQAFKSALIPFQPADYDNLIQERNIEGLCGYGLCPREHRKDDSRGAYRITWGAKGSGPGGRGRDMNIVPREKLEMWCSDECAERALYIRVQLAEEPVWERRADDARGKNLLLLEEGRATTRGGKGSSNLAGDMSKLSVRDSAQSRELALERGDANPALRAGRVDVQIQEKDNLAYEHVTAPEMRPGDDKGGSIEGYVPQEF